ncbi:MAG: hypothetical protein Q9218_002593 [Villophora microphyllina]
MLSYSVLSLIWLFPVLIQSRPAHELEAQDDTCDDFATCDVKGLHSWNDLYSTITTLPIYDRTDGQAIFAQHYRATSGKYAPDADIQQDLQSHDIDITHMEKWTVDSVDQTTQFPNRDDSYVNAFNTKDGVIVAIANWKQDDTAEEKLQWSELMYNVWHEAQSLADQRHAKDPSQPPGGPISNLRIVVQQTVINSETMSVLRTMYEKNGFKIVGDPTWQLWDEQNTPNWFYAILGTPNVRGTLWLLNDHAAEIGGKMPVRVYTRWQWQWPDIWIEIEEA